MPRDGSGIYHRPVGTDAVTDTTIESTKYNVNVADVETDLNTPRPILAGGTGATSADGVLDNISAEKFKQVVTNWDTTAWRAGSFYAATTATGAAPVAGHAFAGICYYANATDLVQEVTDLTDAADTTDATDPSTINQYIRVMTAGVWGGWKRSVGGALSSSDYLFDSTLTFPPAAGQIRFNNATQNSTTEIFVSHTTAGGIDNTGLITASIKSGYTLYIQDKDEPAKYKTFVTTANPVLSGGDFRVTVTFLSGGTDIVSAQRVVLSVTTGSAVCYDIAQSLTINQQSQGRANIGVQKKNYVINGAMQVSQEYGTVGLGGVSNVYGVDQFALIYANAGAMGTQQMAIRTPGGSPNRLRIGVSTADATVGATDQLQIYHPIEGLRVADLGLGTASAKTFTLQFGVKAPAGTYCVSFINAANNRSYVAEYVIAAGEANTDVVKTITVPGDTSGTWATDNTIGLALHWALMAGTSFQQAAGSWGTGGNVLATANQFNLAAFTSNVFELFDVGLYEGSVAPPFMMPDYASELALCKRYWQCTNPNVPKGTSVGMLSANTFTFGGTALFGSWPFNVLMRASPTFTTWNNGVQNQWRNSLTGALVSAFSSGSSAITPSGITEFTFGAAAFAGSTQYTFDLQLNARL